MPPHRPEIKGEIMKTDPNASAFANGYEDPGLTVREYFAAMAMQGILANEHISNLTAEHVAIDAVKCADYLIAELNSPPKGEPRIYGKEKADVPAK